MPVVPSGRRAALLAAGALAGSSLYLAGGAAADHSTTTYSAQCVAQLLSLSVGGSEVLASPGAECDAADSPKEGLLPPIDASPLPLQLRVLYETATTGPGGDAKAEAGVAHVVIPLNAPSGNQLPDITVDVLTSEATCDDGVASGSSKVVGIAFGPSENNDPEEIALPPGHAAFEQSFAPLPLVVSANQQETGTTTTTSGATTTTTRSLTQTALEVHALTGTPIAIDLVVSRTHVDCTTRTTTTTPPPPPPPRPVVGGMTGGGQLPGGITHSLVLPCTTAQKHPGPKLHVETPNGKFDLTALSKSECSQAGEGPGKPEAGFNTLKGEGTGTCNGRSGVDATFTFTDGGEPNKGADKASVTIDKDNRYGCRVVVTGATVNGNQQAHRSKSPPN